MDRLPNLNAIRVFEVVGRHASIAKASVALNVSAGAVSRYIQMLEAELGGALFQRTSRGLVLTEEGRLLLEGVSASLDRLRAEAGRARARMQGMRRIVIWSYPTFAVEWLIPRLKSLRDVFPELDLDLQTAPALPANILDTADIAIVDDTEGEFQDVYADLHKELYVPVCDPRIVTRSYLEAVRLRDFHIISTTYRGDAWSRWFAVHLPAAEAPPTRWLTFDRTTYAIRAAKEGVGIAMSTHIWSTDALRSGELALACGLATVRGPAVKLVLGAKGDQDGSCRRICDWIIQEVRHTEELWTELSQVIQNSSD